MASRRERVLRALNFQKPDQLPKDLSGMASTGISCFAYPKLVAALGLPPRLPRVFDTGQMLALPDRDVLDALDCDVVTVQGDRCTNAFEEPERWHPYDYNGRLPSLVMNPQDYKVEPDGSIVQGGWSTMVPGSYVFDAPHGGEVLDLEGDLKREDPAGLEKWFAEHPFSDEQIRSFARYCRRARESTDRAILFSGFSAGLFFRNGMANYSMLCLSDPDYVKTIHEIVVRHTIAQAERVIPALAPYVDVLMLSADDQGMQSGPILPPPVYAELFAPYYRRINDAVHRLAPQMKTFYHCCGAIYDLLDSVVAGGFDALNPVQWSAGGHSYREWKDKCRGRLALWGGGVNTQTTLPLGSVADVKREVAEVVPYMARDSGYVFCAIHNLLAEIPPEKVLAIYRAAGARGRGV
jgi:uroporphyrinogen decarboxylase